MNHPLRLLLAAVFAAAILLAPPARAQQKGAMQIGLAARYAWPAMDLDELTPAPGYGVVFHYFLTSTTSVDGNLDYLSLSRSVEAPGGDAELDYTLFALAVGLRYRPKVDLLVRPFAEAGLGYEFWTAELDARDYENRGGNSIIYFLGLGYDWEVYEDFYLTTGARYYYAPMRERLEDGVITAPDGSLLVTKQDLANAGLLTAGLELTYRFK